MCQNCSFYHQSRSKHGTLPIVVNFWVYLFFLFQLNSRFFFSPTIYISLSRHEMVEGWWRDSVSASQYPGDSGALFTTFFPLGMCELPMPVRVSRVYATVGCVGGCWVCLCCSLGTFITATTTGAPSSRLIVLWTAHALLGRRAISKCSWRRHQLLIQIRHLGWLVGKGAFSIYNW